MRAKTRNTYRIVVAVVFIALGLFGAVNGVRSIILNIWNDNANYFSIIWSLAFNVVMMAAGFFGLVRIKKQACLILTTVLFIGFSVSAITGLIMNSGALNVLIDAVKAVGAWFFIGCIDKKR